MRGIQMMRNVGVQALLALVMLATPLLSAAQTETVVKPYAARQFAALPQDVRFPEGLTVNPRNGDFYVATFNLQGHNKLLRLDRKGRVEAQLDFGATPLLGLAFDSATQQVYICNAGALAGGVSQIDRVAADFSAGTQVETVADVPLIGAPPARTVDNPDASQDVINFGDNASVPNAIVFDNDGNLYFSDSFQGAVFRIDDPSSNCPDCTVNKVIQDGRLGTPGFPAFGANGLALSQDGSTLFIANTGDDRVLRLALPANQSNTAAGLDADALSVFSESINGADGLAMADDGTLWVAANQADQIVGLNDKGRVIAELGEFFGLRANGAPRGLLFPASPVIVGNQLFVTNAALALTSNQGDEAEEQVSQYTLSRMYLPLRAAAINTK